MYYQAVKVNENGKALVCPHCENEAPAHGVYCKICGFDIVNHCCDMFDEETAGLISASCGNVLDGDARYCPKCGNESNFFKMGWLGDWKGENVKKAIRNTRNDTDMLLFSNIRGDKAE